MHRINALNTNKTHLKNSKLLAQETMYHDVRFTILNKKLHNVLLRGVEKFFTCENLLLPRNTLSKATQDILRMSTRIPNGLRGILIELYVRTENRSSVRIAKIIADPAISPSIILKVTLDEDVSSTSSTTLALRKGYTIEKCKMCLPIT